MVHQESYRKADIPMLSVVLGNKTTANYVLLHSSFILFISILLYFVGPFGEVYLIGSLLFGTLFLVSSIRLWQQPQKERASINYKLSGIHLLGLLLVMAVDTLV